MIFRPVIHPQESGGFCRPWVDDIWWHAQYLRRFCMDERGDRDRSFALIHSSRVSEGGFRIFS